MNASSSELCEMSANCDEYTPDPLTVRAIYATLGGAADTKAEKRGEAFDRMLAKEKAEAAAEALEREGSQSSMNLFWRNVWRDRAKDIRRDAGLGGDGS